MNAVDELAKRDCDAMHEAIDCTRAALGDKLEALQDRVMGTVQNAQEAVEDSIQTARDAVATVKRAFDIKHHVEQHPWAMVGGCCLAGLALGTLFHRVWRRPRQTPDQLAGYEAALSATSALHAEQRGNGSLATTGPLPPSHSAPPPRPGCCGLFHEEIAGVKGMAIGYVMGLARDAIKDAMPPKLASQIDGLMNSLTTKLGGVPA